MNEKRTTIIYMASKQVVRPCLALICFIIIAFAAASSSSLPTGAGTGTGTGRRKMVEIINREGPYLGLITVFTLEEDAFFDTAAFKPHPEHPYLDLSGRRYRVGTVLGKKVIYVRCGVGMVNAAAATQQMVDVFEMEGIIHFGIARNTNSSLSIGDVTVPTAFAQTGLWDWLKPNGSLVENDVAELEIGEFNDEPKGEGQGINLLGKIGYCTEQFFSNSGQPNTPQRLLWFNTTSHWLHLASSLQGMKLEQCVNSSTCLPKKPEVVIGLRGSTANIFVDNAAYREFLFQTFKVSSHDMESAAVLMTGLSNGHSVIVIRALSNLAGAQTGNNTMYTFGPLAALNAAKVVLQFIKILNSSSTTYRKPLLLDQ